MTLVQSTGPFKNLVTKDAQDGNLLCSIVATTCVVEGLASCQCPVANHAQRMVRLEACKGMLPLHLVDCQPAAFAGAKDGGIEPFSLQP